MRKFLIVDDNVALAENLAEIIAGADVGEAALAEDGVAALALVAGTQYDAMLSDVRMPGMSGVELLQRMRIVDPELPVVLMTAYTTADELMTARHEGVLCILPKPVPIARLLDLLVHARRDGVVALVGPDTALRDGLAEDMSCKGFAAVAACSLSEAATLGGCPFAALVDIRTLSDLDSQALLRRDTVLPQLPILALATESQRSALLESVAFTTWSDPQRLMSELESLSDRGRENRSTRYEAAH